MNSKLKIIGLIFYWLRNIIILIIGVMLLNENNKSINILTNNQLLGLILILYVLMFLNKRVKRET